MVSYAAISNDGLRVVDMWGHGPCPILSRLRNYSEGNGFDEGPFVARRRALLTVSLADDEVLELSELLVN